MIDRADWAWESKGMSTTNGATRPRPRPTTRRVLLAVTRLRDGTLRVIVHPAVIAVLIALAVGMDRVSVKGLFSLLR